MQEEKLSYSEICRRFDVNSRDQIKSWELYHIGSSCAQHGDNHAERGICKNSGRNKPHSSLWSGLAVPTQTIPTDAPGERCSPEHEPQGKLSGQCCDRKFLRAAQKWAAVFAGIPLYGTLQTGTAWISGLLQQPLDQGKTEGLAACNSQTASPFGCLNNFYFKILSNFWGSLHRSKEVGMRVFNL